LSQELCERKHVAYFTFSKFQPTSLRTGQHKTLFVIRPIRSPNVSLESLSQVVYLCTKNDRASRTPQRTNEPSILFLQRVPYRLETWTLQKRMYL